MDWHMLVTNTSMDIMHEAGLEYREVLFPVTNGYAPGSVAAVFQDRPEGFVVVDPGPKSIRSLYLKMQEEGVETAAQIYDFIRITLVGVDKATCERNTNNIID